MGTLGKSSVPPVLFRCTSLTFIKRDPRSTRYSLLGPDNEAVDVHRADLGGSLPEPCLIHPRTSAD